MQKSFMKTRAKVKSARSTGSMMAINDYVCEVRYGSGTANALQRGLWTHTKNGLKYFDSVTNGWINYAHNKVLVSFFSHALVATSTGHEAAMEELKKDVEQQKKRSTLR